MKKFLNLITSVIFIAVVSICGILILPEGGQKLEYLAFRYLGLNLSFLNSSASQKPETVEDFSSDTNDENTKREDARTSSGKQNEPAQQMKVNENSSAKLHKNRRAVNKVVGENYLDAVLSAGKLERWNPRSFPLKIYINAGRNVPSEYITEVKNAFSTWQETSKNFITFTYTNNPADADFYCNFPSDLKNRNCDKNGMGVAAYQYFEYKNDGSIARSRVEFSPYACDGRLFHRNMFYSTALHELGHGLGLRGHSTNPKDLMYPIASTNERVPVSKADLNTLRAIYSIIPDTTNIPFTEADKKKLVTTGDIWGEGSARADFTIDEIKKNIALTPNQPSLYVELAEALKAKGDYNGAIKAYSQALKLVDNQESADGILFEAAQLYLKLGQNLSAQKCLDKVASRTRGKNDALAGMYMNLAVMKGEKKEFNEARLLLDKSLMYTNNEELKQMIYKNFLWIAYQQKDRVLYNKYAGLVQK